MGLPDVFDMILPHFGDRIRKNEPMRRHTTFRVGGPADLWVMPSNTSEVALLVHAGRKAGVPVTVIGGGSNILVPDTGIRGIAIHMGAEMSKVKISGTAEAQTVTVEAGHSLPGLCRLFREKGWAGLGFAVGIPGTIGGAIRMNAGTQDGAICDVITGLTAVTPMGEVVYLKENMIHGSYRQMHLSADTPEAQAIVTEAILRPVRGNAGDLYLDAEKKWRYRRTTQPALPSAGCTFRNPSSGMPAGRLIDEAGLKGMTCGDAEISTVHANFIVNRGNAKAADILTLIRKAKKTVKDRFDIDLELEIRVIET